MEEVTIYREVSQLMESEIRNGNIDAVKSYAEENPNQSIASILLFIAAKFGQFQISLLWTIVYFAYSAIYATLWLLILLQTQTLFYLSPQIWNRTREAISVVHLKVLLNINNCSVCVLSKNRDQKQLLQCVSLLTSKSNTSSRNSALLTASKQVKYHAG